ncbi:MAG: Hsp20/alpha crystallin family protein [Pseudolabrys sp.]
MAQEIKKPEPAGTLAPRYRDPFAQMRDEMDRVFDSFLGRNLFGRPTAVSSLSTAEMVAPDIDVRENDKEITFEAELPGIDEKDVQITVRDGVLSLKGEKKSERDEKKETYHLIERSFGSFERSFRLPDTADQDKISADFSKGVLRVVVPKRAEAVQAEKKIPIGKS